MLGASPQVLPALGLSEIAMIKVDVAGGELEVLQGLERTLRTYRPAAPSGSSRTADDS